MSARPWLVRGPRGARRANSWAQAVDYLAQDIKTSLRDAMPGRPDEWLDAQAWEFVRPWAEWHGEVTIRTIEHTHKIARVDQ